MADNLVLEIDRREPSSKNAVRRLRAAERIPGIIYGAELEPAMISLANRDIARAMQSDSFFSQIIDLKLGSKSQQVVIRDLQRHPATNRVLHIDFMRVREDREIQVSIPIRFLNEERCEGVRLGGGIVSHHLIEVEVNCLPRNLPEYIEIDVEHLQLNQSVHLSDLTLPENVELVALMQEDTNRDVPIVSVQQPKGSLADEEEDIEAEALEGEELEGEDVDGEEQPTEESNEED